MLISGIDKFSSQRQDVDSDRLAVEGLISDLELVVLLVRGIKLVRVGGKLVTVVEDGDFIAVLVPVLLVEIHNCLGINISVGSERGLKLGINDVKVLAGWSALSGKQVGASECLHFIVLKAAVFVVEAFRSSTS